MTLSIEQLKSLFPPDSYLDDRRRNLIAQCPQCGYKEFGISLEENHVFGCYRAKKCGFTGNIYTLLKFLDRTDLYVSTRHSSLDEVDIELREDNHQTERELDLTLPSCSLPLGWKRVYDHPYLNERGFTKQDYERYEVGVANLDPRYTKGYVIFAVREDGEVKGYVARCKLSKQYIDEYNTKIKHYNSNRPKDEHKALIKRYINSSTDFSKMSYGFEDIIEGETTTLMLVEGIFDKVNVDKQLELDTQTEIKCNATFKCACSPEQIYKWKQKGIKDIILLYDPDVIDKIKKVGYELQKHFNVRVGNVDIDRSYLEDGVWIQKEGDIGEAFFEEIELILTNLLTVDQFALNKVNVKKIEY